MSDSEVTVTTPLYVPNRILTSEEQALAPPSEVTADDLISRRGFEDVGSSENVSFSMNNSLLSKAVRNAMDPQTGALPHNADSTWECERGLDGVQEAEEEEFTTPSNFTSERKHTRIRVCTLMEDSLRCAPNVTFPFEPSNTSCPLLKNQRRVVVVQEEKCLMKSNGSNEKSNQTEVNHRTHSANHSRPPSPPRILGCSMYVIPPDDECSSSEPVESLLLPMERRENRSDLRPNLRTASPSWTDQGGTAIVQSSSSSYVPSEFPVELVSSNEGVQPQDPRRSECSGHGTDHSTERIVADRKGFTRTGFSSQPPSKGPQQGGKNPPCVAVPSQPDPLPRSSLKKATTRPTKRKPALRDPHMAPWRGLSTPSSSLSSTPVAQQPGRRGWGFFTKNPPNMHPTGARAGDDKPRVSAREFLRHLIASPLRSRRHTKESVSRHDSHVEILYGEQVEDSVIIDLRSSPYLPHARGRTEYASGREGQCTPTLGGWGTFSYHTQNSSKGGPTYSSMVLHAPPSSSSGSMTPRTGSHGFTNPHGNSWHENSLSYEAPVSNTSSYSIHRREHERQQGVCAPVSPQNDEHSPMSLYEDPKKNAGLSTTLRLLSRRPPEILTPSFSTSILSGVDASCSEGAAMKSSPSSHNCSETTPPITNSTQFTRTEMSPNSAQSLLHSFRQESIGRAGRAPFPNHTTLLSSTSSQSPLLAVTAGPVNGTPKRKAGNRAPDRATPTTSELTPMQSPSELHTTNLSSLTLIVLNLMLWFRSYKFVCVHSLVSVLSVVLAAVACRFCASEICGRPPVGCERVYETLPCPWAMASKHLFHLSVVLLSTSYSTFFAFRAVMQEKKNFLVLFMILSVISGVHMLIYSWRFTTLQQNESYVGHAGTLVPPVVEPRTADRPLSGGTTQPVMDSEYLLSLMASTSSVSASDGGESYAYAISSRVIATCLALFFFLTVFMALRMNKDAFDWRLYLSGFTTLQSVKFYKMYLAFDACVKLDSYLTVLFFLCWVHMNPPAMATYVWFVIMSVLTFVLAQVIIQAVRYEKPVGLILWSLFQLILPSYMIYVFIQEAQIKQALKLTCTPCSSPSLAQIAPLATPSAELEQCCRDILVCMTQIRRYEESFATHMALSAVLLLVRFLSIVLALVQGTSTGQGMKEAFLRSDILRKQNLTQRFGIFNNAMPSQRLSIYSIETPLMPS